MSDPGPSQQIIRSFSDDLRENGQDDLASRGLAAKVTLDRYRENHTAVLRDQWNLFLFDAQEIPKSSELDEDVLLLAQSRKLYQAWEKFRKSLPKEQAEEVDGEAPNIAYLFDSVRKASETWQQARDDTKRGRLKTVFSNLCHNCENHSKLFGILPKEDKYISLLTGSISTIAHASINHQEIAEGVSSSLDELSQDIAFWNKQLHLYKNVEILHRYIKELYIVVFEFLTELFTDWCKSSFRRFLTSFDESAVSRLFEAKHQRILAIHRRMEREANLEFQRNTLEFQKHTGERLERMAAQQEMIFQVVSDRQPFPTELLLQLGQNFQRFVEQGSIPGPNQQLEYTNEEEVILMPHQLSGTSNSLQIETFQPSSASIRTASPEPTTPPQHNVYRIQELLKQLAPMVEQVKHELEEVAELASRASLKPIDKQTRNRLVAWITSLEPDKLWVQGPFGTVRPSQNTLTAVTLAALSRQNEIPCVSCFCSLESTPSSDDHAAGMRALLRSVVVQLILLLPEEIETEIDLSPGRFAILENEGEYVSEPLSLVRDLRSLAPRHVHFIFDGLQVLENRSNRRHTEQFLTLVHALCTLDRDEQNTEQEGERTSRDASASTDFGGTPPQASLVTKICFTTDGYVDCLAQLTQHDLIDKIEYEFEAEDHIADETAEL